MARGMMELPEESLRERERVGFAGEAGLVFACCAGGAGDPAAEEDVPDCVERRDGCASVALPPTLRRRILGFGFRPSFGSSCSELEACSEESLERSMTPPLNAVKGATSRARPLPLSIFVPGLGGGLPRGVLCVLAMVSCEAWTAMAGLPLLAGPAEESSRRRRFGSCSCGMLMPCKSVGTVTCARDVPATLVSSSGSYFQPRGISSSVIG